MLIFVLIVSLGLIDDAVAQNIIRHACGIDAEFFKIAADSAMTDAASYTFDTNDGLFGCIDVCTANDTCKAFNTKALSNDTRKCELLRFDRNTNPNDITARIGWAYYDTGAYSSQVITPSSYSFICYIYICEYTGCVNLNWS